MADLKVPRVNKVMISGRITHDLEMKYTPKGTAVMRFNVASDRMYKDESDNWQTATSFIDCVAWTKWAEALEKNAHKGSAVMVEGRLETRTYQDSNNQNRKAWEVIAEYIHFLEWKPRDGASTESSFDEAPLPEEHTATTHGTKDDVPF